MKRARRHGPRVFFSSSSLRILAGIALSLAAAMPACARSAATPPSTGIEGVALVAPVRAGAQREGESDAAPLAATFVVLDARGREVARFETDEDGRFRIALPPGTYTIVPEEGAPILFPRRQRRRVVVPATGFAEVTLRFDTGIR